MIYDTPRLSPSSKCQKGRIKLAILTSTCSPNTLWHSVWLNLMLQGFNQMLVRSVHSTWAGLPKDHQRPATGSKQSEDEVPHCSKTAAGICLWDTWLLCDKFTHPRHYWLSDHSNMKRLPLFEISLWFVSLFPSPEQNRGFPWGHWYIFYTTWTIQKAQIFTNVFVTLAYCLQPAVSRGIKYFHYGLWYCLWYTGKGQHRLPKGLFMALLWNVDINYHIF